MVSDDLIWASAKNLIAKGQNYEKKLPFDCENQYTSGSQIRPPFLWTYVLSMNNRAHSVTCTVQSRDTTTSFVLSHSTMYRQGTNNL